MELKNIRNIGPKTLEKLNAYQIYTPKDLLFSFPKKYQFFYVDNSKAFCGESICFKCIVASRPVIIKTMRNSKAFVFYVYINGLKVKCITYSGDYLFYKLAVNTTIICYGKYKQKEREFSIANIFFDDFDVKIKIDYGFKDINDSVLSNAVKNILESDFYVEDYLPQEYQEKYRLLGLKDLFLKAHFPSSIEDYNQVKRRVRYEDFFWYTAQLEGLRLFRYFEKKAPRLFDEKLIETSISSLPYLLTTDQKKAINDVLSDMRLTKPMNRLIEGDVGCGKSVVAFIASIAAISSGYQVAIMAPTEILAIQHYNNFKKLFPDYSIDLLTSSIKEKDKRDILFRLLHNRINVIIGTHALIQEKVIFANLGLVVIDEQHRFGVSQRRSLVEKFKNVDSLYMTATPIPRTLGLTSFGDLDLSLIKEMPLNRKSVETKIISIDKINSLKNILRRHLIMEEQIYIVVPIINENETLDYIDINKAYDIFTELLPEANIEILHGKMKSSQKDQIMNDFKNHKIDCLISTTVIEVGIDVKNATIMVILNAERYGLSQIHQLRGRVGRGDAQSYCYLVSKNEDSSRLNILEKNSDGFILAEEDFKLRGPGDYLGEEQSGFGSLCFDFDSKDISIWKCALQDSKEYISNFLNKGLKNDKMTKILNQLKSEKSKIN